MARRAEILRVLLLASFSVALVPAFQCCLPVLSRCFHREHGTAGPRVGVLQQPRMSSLQLCAFPSGSADGTDFEDPNEPNETIRSSDDEESPQTPTISEFLALKAALEAAEAGKKAAEAGKKAAEAGKKAAEDKNKVLENRLQDMEDDKEEGDQSGNKNYNAASFSDTDPARVSECFASPFIGNVDNEIESTLTEICTTFLPTTHIAPFTSILQSSGYGKSKTLRQLALSDDSKLFVIYLVVPSGREGNGYPRPTPQQRLLSVLNGGYADMKEQVQAWTHFIKSLLLVGHQGGGTPSELWSKMYIDTDKKFEYKEWFNTELDTAQEMSGEKLTAELEQMSKECPGRNYVIAFDEAGRLDEYEPKNGVPHWRAIRRACGDVTATSINFCGLLVSTASEGNCFYPGRLQDPSMRDLQGLLSYPPITPLVGSKDLREQGDVLPIHHLGRPLWRLYNTPIKAVTAACIKLLCESSVPENIKGNPMVMKREQRLALMYCRFPFFVPQAAAGALVKRHMATVFAVGKDTDQLQCSYISEPVLAAAAQHLTEYASYGLVNRFEDLRVTISQSFLDKGVSGQIGELVTCILLQDAFDRILLDCENTLRASSNFGEIDFKALLYEFFIPQLHNTLDRIPKEIINGQVAFNHFRRVHRQEFDAETARESWGRRHGIVAYENAEGSDVVLFKCRRTSGGGQSVFGCCTFNAKNQQNHVAVRTLHPGPLSLRGLDSSAGPGVSNGIHIVLQLRAKGTVKPTLEYRMVDQVKVLCLFIPDRSWIRMPDDAEDSLGTLLAFARKFPEEPDGQTGSDDSLWVSPISCKELPLTDNERASEDGLRAVWRGVLKGARAVHEGGGTGRQLTQKGAEARGRVS